MPFAFEKLQEGSPNLVRIHKILYFNVLFSPTLHFKCNILMKRGCKINLFRLVLKRYYNFILKIRYL